MDFLELLLTRRSIRKYTGEPIPQEALEAVLHAGLASPASRARRPWELVVVQDPATLEKLSHCRVGSAKMLAGASAAIVVFADQTKTDVWTEDCSILMSNMHLMAHALGLGSCWVQGRLRQTEAGGSTEAFCRELLSVPEHCVLEAILSLGIPAEHPPAYTLDDLDRNRIHSEQF